MSEGKKAKMKELVKKLAELNEEQRKALSSKMAGVVTCEGHPLSLTNSILVYFQTDRPVTMVGGYKQWQKHGRQVKKGENGMLIRFPVLPKQKDPETGETVLSGDEARAFWWTYVFDISQTEERPQYR